MGINYTQDLGQTLYDAVVAPSGGDYTTIGAAFAVSGINSVFVRDGTYTETMP